MFWLCVAVIIFFCRIHIIFYFHNLLLSLERTLILLVYNYGMLGRVRVAAQTTFFWYRVGLFRSLFHWIPAASQDGLLVYFIKPQVINREFSDFYLNSYLGVRSWAVRNLYTQWLGNKSGWNNTGFSSENLHIYVLKILVTIFPVFFMSVLWKAPPEQTRDLLSQPQLIALREVTGRRRKNRTTEHVSVLHRWEALVMFFPLFARSSNITYQII